METIADRIRTRCREVIRNTIRQIRSGVETIPIQEIEKLFDKCSEGEISYFNKPVYSYITAPTVTPLLTECQREHLEIAVVGEWESRIRRVRKAALARNWEASVGTFFAKTDTSRLPAPEVTKHALRLDYYKRNGDVMGGYLYGGAGRGKTRTACLLLKHLMIENYVHTFAFLNSTELRNKSTQLARTGDAAKWIAELVANNAVIFIDDIGHGTASDSYLGFLRQLIDDAIRSYRPLIITSNYGLSSLGNRWESQAPDCTATIEAIIRRVKEYCHPVKFTTANATPRARVAPPGIGSSGGGGVRVEHGHKQSVVTEK